MKLYKYYKKLDKEYYQISDNEELSEYDKYPLSGFTADKKMAKKFRKFRNMDKYIEIISDVTRKEYVDFANARNNLMIEDKQIERLVRYDDDSPIMEYVVIPATWFEIEFIDSEKESVSTYMQESGIVEYPFIFNKKYVKALEILQYVQWWFLLSYDEDDNKAVIPERYHDSASLITPEIDWNEFGIFMSLYGDCF